MGKLSYALKRARKMDYRAMFKTADMLHKKTGKSRVWLMADMAKCAAKYSMVFKGHAPPTPLQPMVCQQSLVR